MTDPTAARAVAILRDAPSVALPLTDLARRLASLAEVRKSVVLVYVVGGFIVVPLVGVLILQ